MGRGMAATGIRTVKQACVPRMDVLGEDLEDAIYAASLDAVARRNDAPPVYGDAATFFKNTHPSQNLKAVARSVFGHLSNLEKPGIAVRLNTGFGGGKTHALIALWHLANHSGDRSLGNDIIEASSRPVRVAVAAIDGQSLGANTVSLREGRWLRTLWHELAWQLGGVEALARLDTLTPDDPSRLPAYDVTLSILPAGPVLILLDEIVLYIAAQGGANAPEATTTLLFIRQLMAIANARPGVAVVITDPGTQAGYGGLTEQLDSERLRRVMQARNMTADEASRAVGEAQAIIASEASRAVEEVDPVGDESVAVLTRRLFESIDPTAATAVAEMYGDTYDRVRADHPHLIPAEAVPTSYRAEIAAAYPFHPRLLRIVRERLQAIPAFQRSRGTLRLFARIVKQIWQGDRDVSIITAGDLDLTVPSTRAELLDRLQRTAFIPAVEADVFGHAPELDSRFATGDTHARIARALLLESLQIDPPVFVDVADLTLATLRPSDVGTEPLEAVRRLAETAWHVLDLGGDKYRFSVEASVMKLLEEEFQRTSETDARAPVRTAVQSYLGTTPLKLVPWPRDAAAVGGATSGTLVLCDDLDLARDVVAYQDAPSRTDPNASRTRRLYRNTIIAVAPRADLAETAYRLARRHLAAQALKARLDASVSGRGQGALASALALEQLRPYLQKLPRDVTEAARQAWNQVILPDNETLTLTEEYVTSAFGGGATTGQQQVLKMLRANGLAFQDDAALGSGIIESRILPGTAPYDGNPDLFTGKAIAERAYQASGMAVFADDLPVRRGLQAAVRDGVLAVKMADGTAHSRLQYATGPAETRQVRERAPGQELPLMPVDGMTVYGRPASPTVKAWFAEVVPTLHTCHCDTPPPPLGGDTVSTWELAKQYARTRPLVQVVLTTSSATAIEDAIGGARAFNAIAPQLSVNVMGNPRIPASGASGQPGDVSVSVTRVHVAQAVQLTQAVSNLARTLDSPSVEAQVEIEFTGDAARRASERVISGIPNEDRYEIQATFGPEAVS